MQTEQCDAYHSEASVIDLKEFEHTELFILLLIYSLKEKKSACR